MLRKVSMLLISMAFLFLVFQACSPALKRSLNVPRITPGELLSRIESGRVTVIDVRRERDFTKTPYKIKGAVREDPSDIESWAWKYPKDASLVLYCA
jgi:rhodanese-related sulfurtransferase